MATSLMSRKEAILMGGTALACLISGAIAPKCAHGEEKPVVAGEGIEVVDGPDFYKCFLLDAGDGYVLVDTLDENSLDLVLDAIDGRNIKLIVLTHGHFDHAGNAAAIARLTGAPIAMSEADLDLLEDNWNQPVYPNPDVEGSEATVEKLSQILPGLSTEPFEPDYLLRDGDSLERFGLDARIVALPGHTDGSIGIDLNGTDLFVGDALNNTRGEPAGPVFAHQLGLMWASMNRVGEMGERTIWYGHGEPTDNWLMGENLGRVL